MNSVERIDAFLEKTEANSLIEASKLYFTYSDVMTEAAFYKALERLCAKGALAHLTKGLYYKPRVSRFGVVPINEQDIVSHYTADQGGVVVGYRLYNKKGLTTQISKQTEVLSNRLKENRKTIQNVTVRNISCELTPERIAVIETLEILQNYSKIEDVNKKALVGYMEEFAMDYSDSSALYVVEHIKYKKSTIAFLEAFLNHMQVGNSLGKHLSALSLYAIPTMEEIYETT